MMRESEVSKPQTPFSRITELCGELRSTPSTNRRQELIADFLLSLRDEEVEAGVLLLSGRVLPETDQRALGIGYRTIAEIFDRGGYGRLFVEEREATILDVYNALEKIARVKGRDSLSRKRNLLLGLYNSLREDDREVLIGAVVGELRIGAVEGLILGGIAKASGIPLEEIRKAYMLSGEIGKIARVALSEGREGIRAIKITLFNPIRPMLAIPAESLEEALGEMGGEAAVEAKYDGARVQIHLRGGAVRIFSRRLTDVTPSLPDVVDLVRARVRAGEAVLEGEVVGVDPQGRPLPFQHLMRRFRRILDVKKITEKIPVELHLFDVLYLDGETLIDRSYGERYLILEGIADRGLLAERMVTGDVAEAEAFFERILKMGHEGVMVKDLESPYVLGRRGKRWLKVKRAETLDLVILGADWGHGRRRGWLSDYYLGAYEPDKDEFDIVGKTFKGLTDEEFRWMTRELLREKVSESRFSVWVRPKIVVEVAFDEIQRSPKYRSGFALRLARITRMRTDKEAKEAATMGEISQLYKRQFRYKGRLEI